LYSLLRRNDSSLQQIGTLLRFDPALTARVLQLGNQRSAARGVHCLSVEHAINQIGLDEIAQLVAHVADSQALVRPISIYGLEADEFWRWSIYCALASEVLAEHTGDDPSEAYTVGLVHMVGMVAIDEWLLRKGPTLMFNSMGFPREWLDNERALFGFSQAAVGAALLRSWNFPVTMVEPVRWQYNPRASAGYARMACLLHAAKWLRTVVCQGSDEPPALPDPAILTPLRLTQEKLSRMVVEVRIRLGSMQNALHAKAA